MCAASFQGPTARPGPCYFRGMRTLTSLLALLALALGAACGGPADPCVGGGTANLTVHLVSPYSPLGDSPRGTLRGPDGVARPFAATSLDERIEFTGVPSGRWTATAEPYAGQGLHVRAAAAPAISPAELCVARGGSAEVTITWSPIESSGHLWVLNGSGGSGALLSFFDPNLARTATVSAKSQGAGPFGRDLTFDRLGNVWSLGATTADAMIVMSEASHLTGTMRKTADRSINIAGVDCLPAVTGLAFDRSGNLWVSSQCKDKVYRVSADQLEQSGTVVPSVVLGGLDAPMGLAFNLAGDLYVAAAGLARIVRYDAAVLGASTDTVSGVIAARRTDNPMDSSVLSPSWLAFDFDGRLWASDFGANVIYSVAAAQLNVAGDNTVTPGVRIAVSVAALLHGLAFDMGGGLWFAYSTGKVACLSPEQLMTSSSAGAPTVPQIVLSSSDIAYASNVAFFPAPWRVPLYHSL